MLKDMEWKVTSPTLLCLSLGTEQRAGGGPCQWRENDSSLVGKQLFPLSTRQSWVLKPTSLVKQLPFASSGYIDDIHRYNTDHLNKVITDLFFLIEKEKSFFCRCLCWADVLQPGSPGLSGVLGAAQGAACRCTWLPPQHNLPQCSFPCKGEIKALV